MSGETTGTFWAPKCLFCIKAVYPLEAFMEGRIKEENYPGWNRNKLNSGILFGNYDFNILKNYKACFIASNLLFFLSLSFPLPSTGAAEILTGA